MADNTAQQNIPTSLNNPGDLKFIGQSGASQDSTGFAKFPTPQEGFGALLNDVQYKINHKPNDTLADFANTYAPPSDNNDTAGYTAKLANQLGVAPNASLSSLQPKIGQFAEAIAKNEGYNGTPDQNQTNQTSQNQEQTNPDNSVSGLWKEYGLPNKASGYIPLALLGGALGASFIPGLGEALGAGATAGASDLAGTAAMGSAGAEAAGMGSVAGTEAGMTPSILSKLGTGALNYGKIAGTGLLFNQGENAIKGILGNNPVSGAATAALGSAMGIQPTDSNQIGQENEIDQQTTLNQLKNYKNATTALSNTLQNTPTGKLLASQPENQEALSYMALHGLLPDTSSGVNDFSGAAKQNSNMRGELSNGIAQVLDTERGIAPIEEARQNAYAKIEKYAPVREQEQQKATVDKEIETYKKAHGDNSGNVSLGNMERSKREQGKAAGDWQKDTPTRAAHKALYGGFRDTITAHTKHKDLYNRVMKEEERSFRVEKLMKKMNGKKAVEHKGILRGVLKSYGKYVGTYLGDKIGGPLRAVVGTMVGDYLTHAVDKKFGKTFFESKEGKRLIEVLSHKSPEIAKHIIAEITKYGDEAEATAQKELKRKEYKEKKKGIMGNHDEKINNPYIPLNELPNIYWGKSATPKKKKPQKGLLTIKA